MSNQGFSQEELLAIRQAESKWWPIIFQSYSTSVLDMMASPSKKGFLSALLFLICAYLYLHFVGPLKQKNIQLYLMVGCVFVCGITYYGQWRKNENLKEIALRSEERLQSKQFDFLNNMVVQGEMFRGGGSGGFLDSAANLVSIGADAYLMKDIYDSRKKRRK